MRETGPHPSLEATVVAQRIDELRAHIDGIDRTFTHHVEIVAVTKGFDGSAIEAAVAAGCTMIGENYAQELTSKRDVVERLGPDVHFIGQLQSNKVRQIADLVAVWETVDRSSIATEVARRAPGATVLIQVDATGQEGKGGCAPDGVEGLVDTARELGLVVDGLMTVGPTGEPPEAARPVFRRVRELADHLGLRTCSMGMSGDVDIAVAEGTTRVRIGSSLFGQRPFRR